MGAASVGTKGSDWSTSGNGKGIMATGITYLFINEKNEHDAKKIMRTIGVGEVNISPVAYLTKLGTLYNIYYIISASVAGRMCT